MPPPPVIAVFVIVIVPGGGGGVFSGVMQVPHLVDTMMMDLLEFGAGLSTQQNFVFPRAHNR